MSKIEALLEVIHLCEENPRLVRALEDLLIEGGPVKAAPENGAAPKQQKPEPKPEPKKAAPQKKPGRKPVDTGKIKSLRQGGWTVAEIADDVGCSQQTVRNNLQKMGMR